MERNNSTEAGQIEPFIPMPVWQKVVFITAYVVMIAVAAGGNLAVIWIVMAHKRMRTFTNYFLVNLAVADTLISLFNTAFVSTFLIYQDWWYGETYCKFSNFINICTIAASVLTFMSIAIDRYQAIIHPLRPRLTVRVVLAIAVIWLVSIVLAFPNLIYGTTMPYGDRIICLLQWPDFSEYKPSVLDFGYNVLILVVTYVLPLVTLTVTYARVGMELWGSRAIGENTPVQYERIRSKRRVVKMMIVVVVTFAVCWLPYHVYFLLQYTIPEINQWKHIQNVYNVIYWLAMSNSMYNPMIYCWMNSRFRHGFVKLFCCCPCRLCAKCKDRSKPDFKTWRFTSTCKNDYNLVPFTS
ncbi:tachykinin-like peptides receptor 99D isoform X3 [Crassostrea virginica]|uniref:Tachykinin-like peptides receptor 99D isoform X3 n=1 Tax=Crassostrea virginica TaxID=6565 RepID=A0A8B8CXH2_CRAVI|nr:tachykinin-like peptides receptor 99D isoform X3 [Crassostrea virginica]XP_022317753.1 tachykinin-like peptides receptor 99D isoform X3 [Crassostrea virginica]XP_022319186.1 tachykinin-like peptides receptor 99D isoform X3 [Crassostrea virginica]